MRKLCYFGNLIRLSYLTVVKEKTHFISQYQREGEAAILFPLPLIFFRPPSSPSSSQQQGRGTDSIVCALLPATPLLPAQRVNKWIEGTEAEQPLSFCCCCYFPYPPPSSTHPLFTNCLKGGRVGREGESWHNVTTFLINKFLHNSL